jgi:four helix bundle protein
MCSENAWHRPAMDCSVHHMGFENLRVYRAAELLDREVKALLASLPLTDDVRQLLRALGSILFNIAEAFGSQYPGRKRYHLVVARGSSDEVRSILRRMASDGLLSEKSILRSCSLTSVIAKMLTSWIGRI